MRCIRGFLAISLVGMMSATSAVEAEQAVVVTGYQINEDHPPAIPWTQEELAIAAGAADIVLSILLHKAGIDPGTSEYGDITDAVDRFWEEYGDPQGNYDEGVFVVTYLPCMMYMISRGAEMAIRLPEGQPLAFMEGFDASGEAFSLELNRDLARTAAVVGSGWSSGINLTSTGENRGILGHTAWKYTFDYEAGLGGSGAMVPFGNMVSVRNTGFVWAAPEVPGTHIVEAFYTNFGNQVGSQTEGSFYGGLIRNMVGMLEMGMPLHTRHEIVSSANSPMLGGAGPRQSGTSESWVTSVSVLDGDPAMCNVSIIPAGMPVTTIDSAMMSGAPMGGATAGGASAPGSGANGGTSGSNSQGSPVQQGCDCSCEAFKKMTEMADSAGDQPTAEQQAMAMCMMQCSGQFMQCAMQMGR